MIALRGRVAPNNRLPRLGIVFSHDQDTPFPASFSGPCALFGLIVHQLGISDRKARAVPLRGTFFPLSTGRWRG